jgi:hypothetical protein
MPHWLDRVATLLQTQTSDLRELARIAGADPRTFYRGTILSDLDVAGQDIDGMEFADRPVGSAEQFLHPHLIYYTDDKTIPAIEAAKQIHHVGRQEERIAILLDLILRNPDDASFLIKLYSIDRAKYANRVLKQIDIEINKSRKDGDLFQGERGRRLNAVQLARIVNEPFSRGMPSNRAALLYYMAKHLARYPDINNYLRNKITNARSVFITPYRRQILDFLNRPEAGESRSLDK